MINKNLVGYLIALSVVFLLIAPAGIAAENGNFHIVKKMNLKIGDMAFNLKKGLIYTYSTYYLYILDSKTNEIKEKVQMMSSSIGPSYIYGLRGIAYDSKTNRIYLTAATHEVWVLNAENYKVMKKIKISTTENPNYGASKVYVDEKTNMVYVQTWGGYTVINGNNDSVVKRIPYGGLDFIHNAIWIWGRNNTYNYYITIRSLDNWKVIKRIRTNITINDTGWERVHFFFSGDRMFLNAVMEYSIKDYTLISQWSIDKFGKYPECWCRIGAYDSSKRIVYVHYMKEKNLTESTNGIMAIDADTGNVLGELDDVTTTNIYTGEGTLSICGLNPQNGYVYLDVSDENGAYQLEVYEFSTGSQGYGFIYWDLLIVAVVILAIVGVYFYRKSREKA